MLLSSDDILVACTPFIMRQSSLWFSKLGNTLQAIPTKMFLPFMLCFIVHEPVEVSNEHIMTADASLRFFGDQEEVHVIFILPSGYVDGISFLFKSEDICR